MVTDYDCWHETEEAVSGEAVMEVVAQNVAMSQRVIREILKRVSDDDAAHLRLRRGAQVLPDHRALQDPGRDAAGAGPDRRQVHPGPEPA